MFDAPLGLSNRCNYLSFALLDKDVCWSSGAMTTDHGTHYLAGSPDVDSYTATGVSNSMLAGRVSFVYNLLGPSMVIDTACSSSLVAIHQGIQAIKNGEDWKTETNVITILLSLRLCEIHL